MSYLKHLVVDIETLSTEPNAVVLALAIVPFTFEDHTYFSTLLTQGLMVKFKVEEQVKVHRRHIEESTVSWWKEQQKKIRDIIVKPSPSDVTIRDGLSEFNQFVLGISGFSKEKSYVWSRGNDFDFPIIKTLFRDANISLPYNHWKIRDVRTAIDIMAGTDNGKYTVKYGGEGFMEHHPLHDSAMDAARLNELFYLSTVDEDIPF